MKIDKIITMGNRNTRLQFLVMERSLRSTGCKLPIWVIPYDDATFDLPNGSIWWCIDNLREWLRKENTHPTMQKYQCLTVGNYQFVDSDVIFLKNPEEVLMRFSGFVASCGHWCNPGCNTVTADSRKIMSERSTIWQKSIFNSGQFACDRPLYPIDKLKSIATHPDFIDTCIGFRFHEQPGFNLLVFLSDIRVTNLTLPPICMESSWAGDYSENYEVYWNNFERKPYLIHWAGACLYRNLAINKLFYNFLTAKELEEWRQHAEKRRSVREKNNIPFLGIARRFKRSFHAFLRP